MAGTEEVDKLSRIYSVLSDDEVEAWVSSEEDPKLPSQAVTAAFREAEALFAEEQDGGAGGDSLEINYRDIAIPRLSEVLSELVWRIVGGALSVHLAIDYLASDKPFKNRLGPRTSEEESRGDEEGKEKKQEEKGDGDGDADAVGKEGEGEGEGEAAEPLLEALCDTIWGVDAMVRGTVDAVELGNLTAVQVKQWGRLCSFVQKLHAKELVRERVLLVLVSEEVLEGSGIVLQPTLARGKKSTPLARAMLKKGTEMMYKQHRFNLQREETEGFAKLLVLVAGVRDGGKAEAESEENMRRLIGYFDLDPNRSLDLTLDALESDPSNRGLLRLVGKFNKENVPHVMGFKLAHYRNPSVAKYHRATVRASLKNKEIDLATSKANMDKVTPRSLYLLIAVLLTTGTMSMEDLLMRVSPGIISLAAKEREYMVDLETKIAKAGSRVVKLDEDGNITTATGPASSDNAMTKLGSMGSLGGGGGYGGGYGGGGGGGGMMGGGSGTLYGGRDRDRMGNGHGHGHGMGMGMSVNTNMGSDRDGRDRDRDGRRMDSRDRGGGHRQSGDNNSGGGGGGGGSGGAAPKANGTGGAAVAGGGGGDGAGADNEGSFAPDSDKQLYGVLEALLDIRAWELSSELLAKLAKQGIDPLRDSGVREALKRLVKDSIAGLASRYPKPVALYPPGARKAPDGGGGGDGVPGGAFGPPSSPLSPTSGVASISDTEEAEAEAGEITLPAKGSISNGSGMLSPTATSTAHKLSLGSCATDLKELHRLPGYGVGFVKAETLSGAVAVLAPLLKILGPHLGRDPVMFARVCRVLAAVNARNPLNIPVKSSSRRGSGSGSGSSSSASIAANLAATNAAAATAAPSVNDSGGAPGKEKSNSKSNSNRGTATLATTTTTTTTKDKDTEPLKAFRSLLGLSTSEARELFSKGEGEGGAGGGQAALQKELARRKGAYIRLVLTVAPCLGMTHANPGLQHEVWAMVSELPYEDRFVLYGAWRGHGMEKHALGVKHVQFAVAEIASGAEISRLIKMLTSDNVRDMARKLGKSSHSHPLLFAEKVLNQLESYDNFISMVADSMRFVGNTLGLDCVAYTMVQHLCQSNRSFVSDSGLTLEKWVTNLSTFAGLLHRKQAETDCKPILSWAVRALGEGGEPAMAAGKVLREMLHKAGGVQVLDGWSITQAQVDGKGGGDVLRQENASFGSTVKPMRKARSSLQDGMEKAGASLPLLILPAHQAESLLYEGGSMDDQMKGKPMPHLKVLAHRADETHTTLLQAMEFVCSKPWVRAKCPTITSLLTKYGLEARVAFHIWRPVINENLMRHWFPKTGTKSEKEHREEAMANRFIGDLEASISKLVIVPDSSPLMPKLVLIFWALSLSDVYIPTKKYAAVVTNMNDAKRRAESKLADAAKGDVVLTKAEKARYLSDKKTCPSLATKLESEKAAQSAHVKRVKNKLKEIKVSLFASSDQKGSVETIDAVLKHLVAPRIGMGPEEAYFCSKFFNTLHSIEAPNFNSLLFYSRSFEGMSTTLLCKTQYEAAGLGFFLKDLLENVKEWRSGKNEAIFKMEAGNKHGFNLNANLIANLGGGVKGDAKGGKPARLTHADFVRISGGWSMQVTKTLLAAVASDEFLLIKGGLIMFNKLIETFPVSQRERQMVMAKLQPKIDKANEPRDDIRVPCTRIVTQLSKQINEAGPDPIPPGQPPAINANANANISISINKAKGHHDNAGGNGTGADNHDKAAGKPAPISTTTTTTTTMSGGKAAGGTNSRGRVSAPSGSGSGSETKGSPLSATAKPYVPGSSASGSATATATATATAKSSSGSGAQSQAAKKEQTSGAAASAKASAGCSSAGGAGAAKRAREGGEGEPGATSASGARRPAKSARGAEQGEVVAGGATAGRGQGKQASVTARESKPLQKTSSSSSNTSGGGASSSRTAAARSSTATPTSRASSGSASASSRGGTSGRADASKQQQAKGRSVSVSTSASASGSGPGGSSSRGRVARTSSGGGGGSSSNGNGNGNGNGAARDGVAEPGGREGRGRDGEGGRREREREISGRLGDADSRAKAMASHDMERPAARNAGTGTLANRQSRDSRDADHGSMAISRTNSASSRMGSGSGVGSGRSTPTEQQGGPAARDRDTGSGSGSGSGTSRRDSREDGTIRGSNDGGGRGRFEGPARAGGGHRTATTESSRSGGGGGGGGGTSRGTKRGRSMDSDREIRGGGRDAGAGSEADGGGEGDPSQAFDSSRMKTTELSMLEPDGPGIGRSRSSVEGWGRGYSGGGTTRGRGRGREKEEGPAVPSDVSSGRYRDEVNPRHGGGGGGGGRMPVPMPSREAHLDRPTYDTYEAQARGGGRSGRSGGGLDVAVEGQDRGGGHGHRESRSGREHPSDDDARSRSSRDGRDSKKSRSDRQRSGSSRGEEGGGGGGGSRKEKKKSSKSKKKKH